MNIKYMLFVIASCFIVAGCSPLAPRPDHSDFFILTPLSDAPNRSATSSANRELAIGLGPIDFPDYLRRVQVVTRSEPNRIELSAQARWAEPLDKNFQRILGENLALLLNAKRIEKYPWARRNQIDYQVTIDVQRFEIIAGGQSQLIARWVIEDGRSGDDLYESETIANTPVAAGDTGASAALSTDLGKLSTDIASHISELSQRRQTVGEK
jgi:uncharacterized protein